MDRNQVQRAPLKQPGWERASQAASGWLPYAALAFSFLLDLVQPENDWQEQGATALLCGLAALWVYLLYTRAPEPRHAHRLRMAVYFAGLLAFATLLMLRQPMYFVFALSGFLHADLLRPRALMVMGIAATSILIHLSITGFPWPTIEQWVLFVTIILVQTLAIGFGTITAQKMVELSEERRQAVARLEAALAENAGLQAQLFAQAREAGVLDERQRLAREIHDTLAQGLTGIITQLEAAKQAKHRPDDWQRHLDNAVQLARTSLSEARRSVEGGRPESLDKAGLVDALAELAQQWSALNNIPLAVKTAGEVVPLHPEVELALLRTAQEALANVAKHARATRVGLTLAYMGDEVTLDVRDDGVGFAAGNGAPPEGGFGLKAMRQRVSRVAGTLAVESEPGGGVAISARVPAIAALPEGRDA